MSFANLIMYGAVLPSYSSKDSKKSTEGKHELRADDPNDQEEILKTFNS